MKQSFASFSKNNPIITLKEEVVSVEQEHDSIVQQSKTFIADAFVREVEAILNNPKIKIIRRTSKFKKDKNSKAQDCPIYTLNGVEYYWYQIAKVALEHMAKKYYVDNKDKALNNAITP